MTPYAFPFGVLQIEDMIIFFHFQNRGRDSMPSTKEELLLLVERYYARRFHQTVSLTFRLLRDIDYTTKVTRVKKSKAELEKSLCLQSYILQFAITFIPKIKIQDYPCIHPWPGWHKLFNPAIQDGRKWRIRKEIWEEIILHEVRMRGRATINVTSTHEQLVFQSNLECVSNVLCSIWLKPDKC